MRRPPKPKLAEPPLNRGDREWDVIDRRIDIGMRTAKSFTEDTAQTLSPQIRVARTPIATFDAPEELGRLAVAIDA
ncbi:MAG: hypothetical protein AAFY66_18355, partial [Pseudomonadota bacterium]